jgi:hypothetical protein
MNIVRIPQKILRKKICRKGLRISLPDAGDEEKDEDREKQADAGEGEADEAHPREHGHQVAVLQVPVDVHEDGKVGEVGAGAGAEGHRVLQQPGQKAEFIMLRFSAIL